MYLSEYFACMNMCECVFCVYACVGVSILCVCVCVSEYFVCMRGGMGVVGAARRQAAGGLRFDSDLSSYAPPPNTHTYTPPPCHP